MGLPRLCCSCCRAVAEAVRRAASRERISASGRAMTCWKRLVSAWWRADMSAKGMPRPQKPLKSLGTSLLMAGSVQSKVDSPTIQTERGLLASRAVNCPS